MKKYFVFQLGIALLTAALFFNACDRKNSDVTDLKLLEDCPAMGLNFGDTCNVSSIGYGHLDSNCVCQPYCPILQANVGDACVTPGGAAGIVDSSCTCKANGFDCPTLQLNIGDSCKTAVGNLGVVNANCNCQ